MRKAVVILGGVAALVLGGGAVARAVEARVHEVRLLLPDGEVARVRYLGDRPANLVMVPAPQPVALLDPLDAQGDFGFAGFDRMAAAMQAEAAAMIAQADRTSSGVPLTVSLGAMPAGAISYSFVSTTSDGGKTCSTSVRVVSMGAGRAPEVARQSAGACPPGGHAVTPAAHPAAPAMAPLVPVSAERPATPVRTTRT